MAMSNLMYFLIYQITFKVLQIWYLTFCQKHQESTLLQIYLKKVSKVAKIRNRYNQVPYLTPDTKEKVTNSQLDITNESQEVSPFPAGDHKAHINRRPQRHSKRKTEKNIRDPQKKCLKKTQLSSLGANNVENRHQFDLAPEDLSEKKDWKGSMANDVKKMQPVIFLLDQ